MQYRHKKTGRVYEAVLEATLTETDEKLVVYRSVETGEYFARRFDMFYDGRFEELPVASTPVAPPEPQQ